MNRASMKNLLACLLLVGCANAPAEDETVAPEPAADGFGETRERSVRTGAAGKADGLCGPFPNWYVEYLDDTKCTKVLPTNRDRELVCPTAAKSAVAETFDGGFVEYFPAGSEVVVDEQALQGVVPEWVRATVILVRRVDGVPHYRYLGHKSDEIVQPWSSTKFMAAANAAASLRVASNYTVGLTASADGHPLGDLVTMIHAYDEVRFTSNGLARYFHDVGGRDRAQGLITNWLKRPLSETFGGNYGMPSAGLGFDFLDDAGSVSMSKDATPPPPNQLSTFTLAEFLKRLVMHREDEATRLPGIQWADVQTLLYGAADSKYYGRADPQGMEADTAVYIQQALSVESVESRSLGQWRVFSKLGAGPSRGGELVNVAYACLPSLDAAGAPVPDVGKEFFIAVHASANGSLRNGDQALASVYQELVAGIMDGRIK